MESYYNKNYIFKFAFTKSYFRKNHQVWGGQKHLKMFQLYPWEGILKENDFVDFSILIGDLPAFWPLSSFTLLCPIGLIFFSPHSSESYGSQPSAGVILLQILSLLINSSLRTCMSPTSMFTIACVTVPLKQWSSDFSVDHSHLVGLLKDTAQGVRFNTSGMNLRICIYKFLSDASASGVGTTQDDSKGWVLAEPMPLVDDALRNRIVSSSLLSFSFLSLGFFVYLFICRS